MDLGQYADRYQVSSDPSCRRKEHDDHWRCREIKGKDGEVWPYNETHLIVAFFHSWRTARSRQGDAIWIPSRRSSKSKRFHALAGADAEVVQDGDEATCFKVPNRYIGKAIKFISPKPRRHRAPALAQSAPIPIPQTAAVL